MFFDASFFGAVTRHAASTGDPRTAAVVQRFGGPARVAVTGRDGVGRGTVAAALVEAGVAVLDGPTGGPAELQVRVVAEALWPEDRDALGAGAPTVVALTKADLTGAGPAGPWADARRTAADLARATHRPVVPVVALLGVVHLTDDDMAVLRALAADPPDLTTVDTVIAPGHPVPVAARTRVRDTLDRFGLAHALRAVGENPTAAELTDRLRALSGIDELVRQLHVAAAPVRYRRVRQALRALQAAAAGDPALHAFLVSDEVVLVVMAAAVDVLTATGVTVDRTDDPAAHRRRAVCWQQRAAEPWDALHARCAADVVRGSLRLLARSR